MGHNISNDGDKNVFIQGVGGSVILGSSPHGRTTDLITSRPKTVPVSGVSASLAGFFSLALAVVGMYADYLTISDLGLKYGLVRVGQALWNSRGQLAIPIANRDVPFSWHVVLYLALIVVGIGLLMASWRIFKGRFVIFPLNRVLVRLKSAVFWMRVHILCDICGLPMKLVRRNHHPYVICPLNSDHSIKFDETPWIGKVLREMEGS